MNHDSYDPNLIRDVLKNTRRIAMIGASPNPSRPSNGVLRFLLSKGYDVVPINPGHAGKEIHGQTVVASLADIEGPIDMVDVFRAADQLPALVPTSHTGTSASPFRYSATAPMSIACCLLTRKDGLIPFCRSEGTSMTATMKPCPTNFSRLRTRKFPETNA